MGQAYGLESDLDSNNGSIVIIKRLWETPQPVKSILAATS